MTRIDLTKIKSHHLKTFPRNFVKFALDNKISIYSKKDGSFSLRQQALFLMLNFPTNYFTPDDIKYINEIFWKSRSRDPIQAFNK